MEYDIAIIGAGAAGIEAALYSCREGLKTVLITDLPIGGRTAYADMVPARIWKESGRLIQQSFNLTGILPFEYRPTLGEVKASIEAAGDDWSIQEQRELERLGVTVLEGSAIISAEQEITITSQTGKQLHLIQARYIIAATGTSPMPIPGVTPDGERILYPKQLKSLENYPETMLILGGNSSACEYASALNNLMVEVTIISADSQILDGLDPQIAAEVRDEFLARGINIELNRMITSAEIRGKSVVSVQAGDRTFTAHAALICLGRTRDYSFLSNESPYPARNGDGSIKLEHSGKSSLPWLFLIGDICGNGTLNHARISAQRAVETIASEIACEIPRPLNHLEVPLLISTTPPVGMVGTVPKSGKVLHFYFSQLPLARIRQLTGHLKLWVGTMGKIEAAAVFGEGSEEVLAVLSVAINMGISFGDLSKLPLCSPSVSELLSHPPMKTETF